MKIIDLLNKIANGEEVPKKIKIDDEIWIYDETDYRASDDRGYLFSIYIRINYQDLNNKVEILEEEKKIPEKLYGIVNPKEGTEKIPNNEQLMFKINEIIDYLKSKGE